MDKNTSENIVKNVFKTPEGLTKEKFTLVWAKMINTIEKNKII